MRKAAGAVLLAAWLTPGAAAAPAAAAASAGTAIPAPLRTLPAEVSRILAAHKVPQDSLSVWVHEVGAPGPLLAFAEQVPRNPASTIKLLTTWAALQQLGPNYRWHTDTLISAPLIDGMTEGDLYLRGHGDPYLVMERLWLLIREVRQRGLRDIGGDLVIDNAHFAGGRADPGAFDGQTYRSYNVLPDALLVNFQTVHFTFVPDPLSNRVEIVAEPRPANLEISNRMQLGPGGCSGQQNGIRMLVSGQDSGGRVTFAGQLGRNCAEQQLSRASLLPGPAFAYGVFRSLWEESGGTLRGGLRVAPAPDHARQLTRFASPPLGELIRPLNKYSNNVMTDHVFLTLGAERFGAPGTLEKGQRAIEMMLAERALDFPELRLENGSGLSRATRISAESLGRLLLAAHEGLYAPEFIASLSLAGIDGTMRRRFGDPAVRGRMYLKTGRLDGTLAVAGYVHGASGRRFVVVSLHQHPDATRGPGEQAQDALLGWLARQ